MGDREKERERRGTQVRESWAFGLPTVFGAHYGATSATRLQQILIRHAASAVAAVPVTAAGRAGGAAFDGLERLVLDAAAPFCADPGVNGHVYFAPAAGSAAAASIHSVGDGRGGGRTLCVDFVSIPLCVRNRRDRDDRIPPISSSRQILLVRIGCAMCRCRDDCGTSSDHAQAKCEPAK